MPTIPAGFSPVVSGYSHGGPRGVVRTEVAGGAARYALDWDRGTQHFQVKLHLDKVQYAVWVAFYEYTIQKGAIAFDMPLDSGFGLAPHSVHIMPGSYSLSHTAGTLVTVDFAVEALSGAYALTDEAVSAYGLNPAELPSGLQPILSGYGHDGPGGAVRDETGGGVAAYAMDWEGGVQRFNCTLILPPEQYRRWAVWYHRLIGKGVQTFGMPLDSGYGLVPHQVNIMPGSYSATRNGTITLVSFAVDAESTVYQLGEDGAADLLDLYGVYGRGITSLFDRISLFSNGDTNVLDF